MTNRRIVQEQYSSGTNGGTPTLNAFNQRSLNTLVENSISGASLGTNGVNLPVGTYSARTIAGVFSAVHPIRVYDFTNNKVLVNGISSNELGADQHICEGTSISAAEGGFTLTGTALVVINDYIMDGGTVTLLGSAVGSGQPEVYAQLTIEQ